MSTIFTISFIIVFIVVLIFFDQLGKLWWLIGKKEKESIEKTNDSSWKSALSGSKAYGLGLMIFTVLGLVFVLYSQLKGTPYEGHLKEWMNIIVRWVHITFGIAWIGTSFYFVFLENALNRKNQRKGIAGNLWSVHGGGFYYLEKFEVAPDEIPEDLHWFKYEAYFTWLSGFLLLCVVYYLNAESYLIDPEVLDILPMTGIAIGIGTLIGGWVVYDMLCKSPLRHHKIAFALVGFALMILAAWGLCHVFNSRAAYIHVGALIGTMMAGNVFFVIIPGQKKMVEAGRKGEPVDPQLGKNAGLRSLHNNYFTLPILFIMISNHFPSTFGHEFNWAVLAGISFASALFKHFLNILEKGAYSAWFFPASVLMLLSITYITAPKVSSETCDSTVPFTRIYSIIQERCTTCHSSRPTDKVWTAPPNGVVYDTANDIKKMSEKIMQRVVITKTMPQNNQTGITQDERDLIRCWILQGSNIEGEVVE